MASDLETRTHCRFALHNLVPAASADFGRASTQRHQRARTVSLCGPWFPDVLKDYFIAGLFISIYLYYQFQFRFLHKFEMRANVPDLTARQLHAVLAVAEYNSFIAAAAFLKTSQPALTRTIKRVEDVLGVRLFDRSTRRVAITAAGKEFVAVAERMLNDLRISISSMREIGQEQRGQIIISSIMSVATGLLPAIVANYRSSRPGSTSCCVKVCMAQY